MAKTAPKKMERSTGGHQGKIEIEIEPGGERRLAHMLKKVLNTPPKHASSKKRSAPNQKKASKG